jgi:site-specific recombinase XerC
VPVRSSPMIENGSAPRDLESLAVPVVGVFRPTGRPFEPFELLDASGAVVAPVAEYLKELQAVGRPETTQRSYGSDLLRWFRFVWSIQCPWEQATRVEARDFSRWIQVADKLTRPHWRTGQITNSEMGDASPGSSNPVTGKRALTRKYAPATVAHAETVLRGFYDYQIDTGAGPMVNPFPLVRAGRGHAHHNPMEPFGKERAGLFRPRLAKRLPRSIPDVMFEELFLRLSSHRDRALVAFWISTGARASELLGVLCSGVDPGQQLITVIRKGSRALQPLPASPDAFVWLRLYQEQMFGLVPTAGDEPLWWTRRRPFRPLGYPAARAMFDRANAMLGSDWTLHDLRHSAAYRLARDPQVPISDVQWILGHAHLSTTQIYVTPMAEDVVENVLGHHRRQAERASSPPPPAASSPYRPETMDVLFGRNRW